MKTKIAVFCLGLVCALVLLEGSLRLFAWLQVPRDVRQPGKKNAVVIACFGDSFTYGIGAPQGMSYPEQLQRMLNAGPAGAAITVINHGVPGQNTSQLLEIFEGCLERDRPDAVTIMSGGANSWNFYKYADFRRENRFIAGMSNALCRLGLYKLGVLLKRDIAGKAARQDAQGNTAVSRIPPGVQTFREKPGAIDAIGRDRALGNYAEAIRRVTGGMYDDPVACSEIGLTYRNMRDYEKAFASFAAGIRAEPGNPGNINYQYLAGMYLNYALSDDLGRRIRELFARAPLPERCRDDFSDVLGGNRTATGGRINAWVESDLSRMVEICRARHIPVLLVDYPLQYDPRARNVARKYRVPLVDTSTAFSRLLEKQAKENYFVADGHCSQAGYAVIAGNIRQYLESTGLAGIRPEQARQQ